MADNVTMVQLFEVKVRYNSANEEFQLVFPTGRIAIIPQQWSTAERDECLVHLYRLLRAESLDAVDKVYALLSEQQPDDK